MGGVGISGSGSVTSKAWREGVIVNSENCKNLGTTTAESLWMQVWGTHEDRVLE